MGIREEMKTSLGRFRQHAEQLTDLLRRRHVSSLPQLLHCIRKDPEFSAEWRRIWASIASSDGGKLSFSTAGAVLGYSLGGVGIAAMGGAIGVPLLAVLGLGGLLAGASFDSHRRSRGTRDLVLELPESLFTELTRAAHAAGVSEAELVSQLLQTWSASGFGASERAVQQANGADAPPS